MALPDLIEIVPLDKPVHAEITVPGSKSITNRALVLAALAGGETTLLGALWSEDTQVMVECLQELGYMVNVAPDPNETCNRTITVYGQGGKVPRGGSTEQPLELFVGNAGTAARFLAAMVCLGEGVYRLHGVPRMHERPQAGLFQALRQLGYRIDSPNDRLPALIHGAGPKPGKCRVSLHQSSQFASAILLNADRGGWKIELIGQSSGRDVVMTNFDRSNPSLATGLTGDVSEELPYVVMTVRLRQVFPKNGGKFRIEPDASSGSYFWAAGRMAWSGRRQDTQATSPLLEYPVTVVRWPRSEWQVDAGFPSFLLRLPPTISRLTDLGDSIMTAMIVSASGGRSTQFTQLGRLRVQECERVVAMRTELSKCGVEVLEVGDTLTVTPNEARLHGAEIETYNDHRMAMCFAILGLKVPGIKIKNPACVKKTFPNFFQKLAAAPPHGLGATLLDASGRRLAHEELFAD